jgi:hypothetical protein
MFSFYVAFQVVAFLCCLTHFITHVYVQRPVIITGALEDWPARSGDGWTLDKLMKKYGHYQVAVSCAPDGNYDIAEDVDVWVSDAGAYFFALATSLLFISL